MRCYPSLTLFIFISLLSFSSSLLLTTISQFFIQFHFRHRGHQKRGLITAHVITHDSVIALAAPSGPKLSSSKSLSFVLLCAKTGEESECELSLPRCKGFMLRLTRRSSGTVAVAVRGGWNWNDNSLSGPSSRRKWRN